MKFDRHSLALALGFSTFVAVTGIVPTITAERPRTILYGVTTVPVDAADVLRLDGLLRTPGVSAVAKESIQDALSLARVVASAHSEDEALQRAHDALMRADFRRAEAIVVTLIEQVEADAQKLPAEDKDKLKRLMVIRNQSMLLRANVAMQQGEAAAATKILSEISPDTPVNDHVLYLLAEGFEAQGDPEKAAQFFGQVGKLDSPLKHRAIARQSHQLFESGDYEKAAKALEHVIETYPIYPRRWLALWQHAEALEKLGKKKAAAQAYHDTWFEFPYKKVGQQSRARVVKLAKQKIVPAKLPSARERYDRFRQLRINKHWDIARALFTELKADHATPEGHSDFEHDIDFQLALNAYAQREFDEAKTRLEALHKDYEAGNRRGISRYLLYKYLSATYQRLGDTKAAFAALEKMSEGYGANSAKRAKAELHEELGQSAKALAIYKELYSKYKKRGWHYSWLLYKSGKFEEAYENFARLAERSSGSRRAKYLYWAARTLERAGKTAEARGVFAEIAEKYDFDYYALQAHNRATDIDQRSSVAGQLAVSAESISSSADEVLDALEEASAKAGADAFIASDPRAKPRHALWGSKEGPTNWTLGAKCDPKDKTIAKFCRGGKIAKVPTAIAANVDEEDDQTVIDDDPEPTSNLDERAKGDAKVPTKKLRFNAKELPRIDYSTSARIYWDGRLGSGLAFARARQGELVGPVPEQLTAYDEPSYIGGLERAASEYGELFPELTRSYWLYIAGFEKGARWAARDVAIEFRELRKRYKARRKPHEIDDKKWNYFIDNRRKGKSGFWGIDSDELRYPVPNSKAGKQALLERQQKIHELRFKLDETLTDALKEVGDHYMVRKLTLAKRGWYREDLRGSGRKLWMQAYPRAFPRLVVANGRANGINPYLLWALMTVESSYNPDSLSTADALGLLQVIPRTGLKTAIMLGDEEFGPFDLLEADTAIQHGSFYFSRLVRKFRGQELFAIAGYNGGPHRVGDWVEDRGHTMPMDEFVEEIPFNQARLYVKKVLRFLTIYLAIYEGRDDLYVGQNVRTDYRPDPNF